MKYVIQSKTEHDDDGIPLFWSNTMGWVSLMDADLFSEDDRNQLNLPLGGVWEPAL